jgi:hypothetical protein
MSKVLACAVGLLVMLSVIAGRAQDIATINPEAIEFDSPALDAAEVTAYRVEIFVAGADPDRDVAVAFALLGTDAREAPGRIRVKLSDVVQEVPNGRYVAVVRAIDGSVRTESSAPFVLAREESVEDTAATQKQERFWTKVAIAIGGSMLLLPYVLK